MDIDSLKFDEKGLIPAIIQDINTQVVLMQAYMNRDSLLKTIESGKVCFFSRSRQRLWVKGEKSGHYLYLKEIRSDCDKDALLVKVTPAGPVCHTGKDTWLGGNQPALRFPFLFAGISEDTKRRISGRILYGTFNFQRNK